MLCFILFSDDFNEYNKILLDISKDLIKREHYIYQKPIIDLHFEDINELNVIPEFSFKCSSIITKNLDNYGRLTLVHNMYYLNPAYAYKRVQVKLLPNNLEIYTEEGDYLLTTPRLVGKPGIR